MAPSNAGHRKTGSLKRAAKDVRPYQTSRLAQVLLTRLSYANLKVSQGWIKQNINEVEHLYSSRFKGQAEQRRLRRRASSGVSARTARRLDWSALQASHPGGTGSRYGFSASVTQPIGFPTQGPRPFADEQHYTDLQGSYQSNTASVEPLYASISGTRRNADQNHLYPSNALYPGQRFVDSDAAMQSDLGRSLAAADPPAAHLSPNMSSYLVSPILGSTPRMESERRPSGDNPVSSDAARSSKTDGAAQSHPTSFGETMPTTLSGAIPPYQGQVSLHADLGTPGVSAPVGSAAANSLEYPGMMAAYPYAPAPGITPRLDTFNSTFPSNPHGGSLSATVFASPAFPVQRHARNDSKHGHRRIPSLRGDYSAGSVTMDDLDSHFGQ